MYRMSIRFFLFFAYCLLEYFNCRDGVSEGQFMHVLQHELTAIREACIKVEQNIFSYIFFLGLFFLCTGYEDRDSAGAVSNAC